MARATPLDPIRDYLQANLREAVSISALARLSGLTEFHLIRAFRRQFGLPPHAYHVRLRLARAAELIAEGNTVGHAAHECGFADQSHLSRKFKEVYGTSPLSWVSAAARRERQRAIPFTTKRLKRGKIDVVPWRQGGIGETSIEDEKNDQRRSQESL